MTALSRRVGINAFRRASPTYAVPAYRGTPQLSLYATGTTIVGVSPSSTKVGDMVRFGFYLGATKTLTKPDASWTQRGSALAFTGAAAGYQLYSFYKFATADGAETFTFSWTGSTDHNGLCWAISGVEPSNPFSGTGTQAAGSSTSISAPSITPDVGGCLLDWFGMDWNGVAGTETATTGLSPWQFLTAPRDPMLQGGIQATATASGAKAVTIATAPWAVTMDALRPALLPDPPAGPVVVPGGSGALALSFNPITGADGYQMRYRQTGLTPPSTVTQTSAPLYLARLTDATPGASTSYVQTWNGSGCKVYPIDWGVRPTHTEFAGRTLAGHDMQTPWNTDSINHGTGTLAMAIGVTYGVAKAAGGYEVGGFTTDATNLSTAFGYITTDAAGAHAPVFMPFDDTDASALTTTMLDSAIAAGLIPILSAGNVHSNMDVGSDPWAGRVIRVGASDPQDDTEASFSRYGTAVLLWAPNGSTGTAPNTAGNGSDSATRTEAGTSESAAMVAGQVAKILQANSALNFYRVKEMLLTQARPLVTTPNQSNQPLLNGETSPENWTIRDLGSSTSVTHDSLGSSTTWEVQVRTVKGGIYSAWSSTVAATAGV